MTTDTDDFEELLAAIEAEGGDDKFIASMRAAAELNKHVADLIKSRQFTITGDESHLSVKFILNQAANIDKPRKYDFQDEDVNERNFIRSIKGMLPDGIFGMRNTPEEFRGAIDGTNSVTFKARDHKCYDCAKPLRLTLTGNKLHLDCESACENNSAFFVDIDFPTGEVVFADWPDRFSEIKNEGWLDDGDEGESINYIKGQRQRSERYAAQGIFHLSVGNSCPSWYYNTATGEIRIGNDGDEWDDEADGYNVPEGFEEMGSFCTDLWWVTMLDRSRYDEMLSKIPQERDKNYYSKAVETATIKPGRYRFHSVPSPDADDDGDYGRLFATAEYLGPCGEIPKLKHISEGRVNLTPRQYAIASAKRYPSLYSGQFEEVRFRVADQIFNVLGNGIRSKGEFLSYISVPVGTEISDEMPQETGRKSKWDNEYVRAPYPNFKREYSLLGDVPIADIPTDWLEEMVWFYNKCRDFFNGPDVSHYSYAYPNAKPRADDQSSWEKALNDRRQKTETEEEFFALVTKDYECEYRGDLDDFRTRRWAKELARIHAFLTETLAEIHGELTKRTAVP